MQESKAERDKLAANFKPINSTKAIRLFFATLGCYSVCAVFLVINEFETPAITATMPSIWRPGIRCSLTSPPIGEALAKRQSGSLSIQKRQRAFSKPTRSLCF